MQSTVLNFCCIRNWTAVCFRAMRGNNRPSDRKREVLKRCVTTRCRFKLLPFAPQIHLKKSTNDSSSPDAYSQIVYKISQLLCSANVSAESFNFLERELLKAIMKSDSDWSSGLIVRIMQVIIALSNSQHKLILLLKINPALSIKKTKPVEINLKLLELLFSFVQLSDLKQRLPVLLSRELRKLCDSCPVITRMVRKFLLECDSIPWNILQSLVSKFSDRRGILNVSTIATQSKTLITKLRMHRNILIDFE